MDAYTNIINADAIYFDTSALAKIEFEENKSNLTRILAFMTRIPAFSSLVAFGEFVNVAARKESKEKVVTGLNYLTVCRRLMNEFDLGTLKRAEPIENRFKFEQLAGKLCKAYSKLGGGDIWHLMAALELNSRFPSSVFFSYDFALIGVARKEKLLAINGEDLEAKMLENELIRAGKMKR